MRNSSRGTNYALIMTVAIQERNISKDIRNCFHYLTNDGLIQPLLTTVHTFFQ